MRISPGNSASRPRQAPPYAYDQTYAQKDALKATGDVDDTAAIAAALRGLARKEK